MPRARMYSDEISADYNVWRLLYYAVGQCCRLWDETQISFAAKKYTSIC